MNINYLGDFDVHVDFFPGKQNEVSDALLRYAYPAGLMDVSVHGSPEDEAAMRNIICQERVQEQHFRCVWPGGGGSMLFGGPRGPNHQESHVEESATV